MPQYLKQIKAEAGGIPTHSTFNYAVYFDSKIKMLFNWLKMAM